MVARLLRMSRLRLPPRNTVLSGRATARSVLFRRAGGTTVTPSTGRTTTGGMHGPSDDLRGG